MIATQKIIFSYHCYIENTFPVQTTNQACLLEMKKDTHDEMD